MALEHGAQVSQRVLMPVLAVVHDHQHDRGVGRGGRLAGGRALEQRDPPEIRRGVEAARPTLDAFLQYGHEQGVFHKRLKPEELFPESVQHFHKK